MTFNEAEKTLEAMEENARRFASQERGITGISLDQSFPLLGSGMIFCNQLEVYCRENSCDYKINGCHFTRTQFLLILSTHIETTWSRYVKRSQG